MDRYRWRIGSGRDSAGMTTILDYIAIFLAMGSLLLWAPLLWAWLIWVMWNLISIAGMTLKELNALEG